MESGNIADSKITTSSILDDKSPASQARLNYKADGGFGGGWSSLANDANQWLQVDLGTYTRVTRVATQGRNGYDQWVTKYTMENSEDGQSFQVYKPSNASVARVCYTILRVIVSNFKKVVFLMTYVAKPRKKCT